jgi:hypothetical protein
MYALILPCGEIIHLMSYYFKSMSTLDDTYAFTEEIEKEEHERH